MIPIIDQTTVWVSAAIAVVLVWVAFEFGHWCGRGITMRQARNDGYEAGSRKGLIAGQRTHQPRQRDGRFAGNKEAL